MESRVLEQVESGLQSSLLGDLNDWPLIEILEWIVQSRRSALVRVGTGLRASTVFIKSGQVFRVEHGGATGERALYGLVQVTDTRFQVLLRTPPDAHPNVLLPTAELLHRCRTGLEQIALARSA